MSVQGFHESRGAWLGRLCSTDVHTTGTDLGRAITAAVAHVTAVQKGAPDAAEFLVPLVRGDLDVIAPTRPSDKHAFVHPLRIASADGDSKEAKVAAALQVVADVCGRGGVVANKLVQGGVRLHGGAPPLASVWTAAVAALEAASDMGAVCVTRQVFRVLHAVYVSSARAPVLDTWCSVDLRKSVLGKFDTSDVTFGGLARAIQDLCTLTTKLDGGKDAFHVTEAWNVLSHSIYDPTFDLNAFVALCGRALAQVLARTKDAAPDASEFATFVCKQCAIRAPLFAKMLH